MKFTERAAVAALVAAGVAAPITTAEAQTSVPRITEIHYDNVGTDVGEAIEVFAPPGVDLTNYSLVLYNGANGAVYGTTALSGTGVQVFAYPSNGIQNGSPDGVALVDPAGTVLEFLSYEGTFTGVGGPAGGIVTADIGVTEEGTTPEGFSLQLVSGVWTGPSQNTFGSYDGAGPVDPPPPAGGDVHISEIHYDNDGADTGEAIEVVADAGTDLTGWTLVLYNGSGGATYSTIALAGIVSDQLDGLGVQVFDAVGLQNGAPDGIALVNPSGVVVEFISYEGSFTAVGGPADGQTSTDIGVLEISTTPIGFSLQLDLGTMMWKGPLPSTFGQVDGGTGGPVDPPAPTVTLIHDVQGDGAASPIVGQRVIVEGVVVGDFEGPSPALRGFMVQEEDADADANAATSEGIFVFNGNNDSVSLGDRIRVEGDVVEFNGLTELAGTINVQVLASSQPLPTPAVVEFPVASVDALEAFEGMLATFPQPLVISEYFNYDRFGEIVVALPAEGQTRPMIPTAVFDDDSAEAVALADLNERSRITVDDGLTSQNPETAIHPINRELFSLENAFRGGDVAAGLTGPIWFAFGLYRILPYGAGAPLSGYSSYQQTVAPEAPEDVGGELTVASMNALNYFLTLDNAGFVCGPNRDMECRGADDAGELARQRVKLLNALEGLNADIIGLNEVENTPGVFPLADLAEGLNERLGAGTYAYIAAGVDGVVGTDAIKVGVLYRPAAVLPVGDPVVLDTLAFVDPANTGIPKNRAAVAQTFQDRASGEIFSVVANHLKSKGSGCGAGDDDVLAGSCNRTRTLAAQYLADWIATDPTGVDDDDWLIIGDLNSYDQEDPIDALRAAGFTDEIGAFQGELAYSYVFDGEYGYLDYVLSSASLRASVTGAAEWHINSDEPDIFDYDTTFKSAYQDTLFDPTTPYRSSDHDAALVGLSFAGQGVQVAATPGALWPANRGMQEVVVYVPGDDSAIVDILSVTSSDPDSGTGIIDFPNDIQDIEMDSVRLRAERSGLLSTRTYTIDVQVTSGGQVRFASVTVEVPRFRPIRSLLEIVRRSRRFAE